MFPCDKAQLDSLSVVKSRIMEDKSMMMKDKSMMMNDKSLKVTENKYGRNFYSSAKFDTSKFSLSK